MVNEQHSILRMLIESKEKSFSIRKLSILRGINYKSAYNAVMRLSKEGLVCLERHGQTLDCSFSFRFSPLVFDVESSRREDLLKRKDFKVICSMLKDMLLPFTALVFGSWAKGNSRKTSDIDMLIIINDRKHAESTVSAIPLDIHLTTTTYSEFMSMAKSREFSVVSEAIKNNIILEGIEDYYRLLENAGYRKDKAGGTEYERVPKPGLAGKDKKSQ